MQSKVSLQHMSFWIQTDFKAHCLRKTLAYEMKTGIAGISSELFVFRTCTSIPVIIYDNFSSAFVRKNLKLRVGFIFKNLIKMFRALLIDFSFLTGIKLCSALEMKFARLLQDDL